MIYVTGHAIPSADIDSVFSSILVCGYIENKYKQKTLPININKKNRNIEKLLKTLGYQYPKKYNITKQDVFVLVDHNDPNESIWAKGINNKIYGIIDHRKKTGKIKPEKFEIIKDAGACASIIYQLYKKNKIEISKKQAILFLYAIISDTYNLNLNAKKIDKQIVKEIYQRYKIKQTQEQIYDIIYKTETQEKKSIKKLLFDDLKAYTINNKRIYISNIKTKNKKINKQKIKKEIEKLRRERTQLWCVNIMDIEQKTSEIIYFGNPKLVKLFKNEKYNKLVSRKNYLVPLITRIIKNNKNDKNLN